MKLQVIDNEKDFKEIQPLWNELYRSLSFSTPFQSWAWNFFYWKYFEGSKKLQLLVIRRESQLVGILPLWIRTNQGLKIVEPVGTRGTDYIHLLLVEKNIKESLASFLDWVWETDLDILNLEDIPESSLVLEALVNLLEERSIPFSYRPDYCICYHIKLPSSWEEYLDLLSKRRRKDTLYYRRYVNRHCKEVSFVQRNISELKYHFELHQKSRKIKNDKGAYATQEARQFIKDFISCISCEDELEPYLLFLSLNNDYASTILGIETRGVRYDLTIGYDPLYSRYRPGTLLYGFDIEDCIKRGVSKYDLSRGPDPYKLALGAERKNNTRLIISRSKEAIEKYLENQKVLWKGKDYAPTAH